MLSEWQKNQTWSSGLLSEIPVARWKDVRGSGNVDILVFERSGDASPHPNNLKFLQVLRADSPPFRTFWNPNRLLCVAVDLRVRSLSVECYFTTADMFNGSVEVRIQYRVIDSQKVVIGAEDTLAQLSLNCQATVTKFASEHEQATASIEAIKRSLRQMQVDSLGLTVVDVSIPRLEWALVMKRASKYNTPVTTASPAYILYLLDVSGSMSSNLDGRPRIRWLEEALEYTFRPMIERSINGGVYRSYYKIAMITYSDNVDDSLTGGDFIDASEFWDAGLPEFRPSGSTNTKAAFERAYQMLSILLEKSNVRENCPAPIICHVTDGISSGGDPTPIVNKIKQLRNRDGSVLIVNVFISDDLLNSPIENIQSWHGFMPGDETSAFKNQYARFLFTISSSLPGSYASALASEGYQLKPGSQMMYPGENFDMIRLAFATSIARTPKSTDKYIVQGDAIGSVIGPTSEVTAEVINPLERTLKQLGITHPAILMRILSQYGPDYKAILDAAQHFADSQRDSQGKVKDFLAWLIEKDAVSRIELGELITRLVGQVTDDDTALPDAAASLLTAPKQEKDQESDTSGHSIIKHSSSKDVIIRHRPSKDSIEGSGHLYTRHRRIHRREFLLSLFAIARTNLDEGEVAYVGKVYSVEAGIAREKRAEYKSEPFDLPLHGEVEPIEFDIILHPQENVELISEWQQRLVYHPVISEPQLVTFAFRAVKSGHSSFVVDFYHEQRWLRTIRFRFSAVESLQTETITSN